MRDGPNYLRRTNTLVNSCFFFPSEFFLTPAFVPELFLSFAFLCFSSFPFFIGLVTQRVVSCSITAAGTGTVVAGFAVIFPFAWNLFRQAVLLLAGLVAASIRSSSWSGASGIFFACAISSISSRATRSCGVGRSSVGSIFRSTWV